MKNSKTVITLTALALTVGTWANAPCLADDDADEFTPAADSKVRKHRPVVSSEALEIGVTTARSLQAEGERLLATDQVDKAIKVFQRAIDIDSDDIDVRVPYARALEKKLLSQKARDPYIYSQCVEEWLTVMRNGVGEEKGMGVHGVSLLNLDSGFADEERQHLAREHLKKVVGFAPRPWETNAKFMKRAMEQSSVKGKLVQTQSKAAASD